MRCGICCYK